jgi:hypothetical protein
MTHPRSSKFVNADPKFPISVGSGPSIDDRSALNVARFVRSPISVGIVPQVGVRENSRVARRDSWPISEGMVPSMVFSLIANISKPLSREHECEQGGRSLLVAFVFELKGSHYQLT